MYFEKVSLTQWCDDVPMDVSDLNLAQWYEDIKLPRRGTKHSAGYDFFMPYTIQMPPHSTILIPTGIRWVTDKPDKRTVLSLYPRSGLGFKYGIKLSNTVGIIDADYCDANNEGHIMVKIINPSEEFVTLAKGAGFVQGIITNYLVAEDYALERSATQQSRKGGFGSTDK